MLVVVLAGLAFGGYLLGRASGEDLDAARYEGVSAGYERGAIAGDKLGYRKGYELGARAAYGGAYRESFRATYQAAFREAGLEAPRFTQIDLEEPAADEAESEK